MRYVGNYAEYCVGTVRTCGKSMELQESIETWISSGSCGRQEKRGFWEKIENLGSV